MIPHPMSKHSTSRIFIAGALVFICNCSDALDNSPPASSCNTPTSDDLPPLALVLSPSNGATIQSTQFSVDAWASDSSGISLVEVYLGSDVVCVFEEQGPFFHCDVVLGDASLDSGNALFALASDAAGNIGVSPAIYVNIFLTCDTDDDCLTDYFCYQRICRRECGESCLMGEICIEPPGSSEEMCIPRDEAPPLLCPSMDYCPIDHICYDYQCRETCQSTNDCPITKYCFPVPGTGESVCLPNDEYIFVECLSDDDCEQWQDQTDTHGGLLCYQHQCREMCSDWNPSDCKDTEACVGVYGEYDYYEVCLPVGHQTTSMCIDNSDCSGDQICFQHACRLECDDASNCLPGEVCLSLPGAWKYCMPNWWGFSPACEIGEDCGNGMFCYEDQCRFQCKDTVNCFIGEECITPDSLGEKICVPF